MVKTSQVKIGLRRRTGVYATQFVEMDITQKMCD
jgi:hypothetical protein